MVKLKKGIYIASILFVILLLWPKPQNIPIEAWHTLALTIFMATLWMTTALPIHHTALFPIIAIPLLKINNISSAIAPYFHPIVFLFLGGFYLAIAMQQSQLHKRIALLLIMKMGLSPQRIILAMMITCAFLSMWMSNTAAAIMMLPIAVTITELIFNNDDPQKKSFSAMLLLSIAYSCSIGGMGTIIGTPVNAFMVGFIEQTYQLSISFVTWSLFAMPIVIVGIILSYFALTRILFAAHHRSFKKNSLTQYLHDQYQSCGQLTLHEKIVAGTFMIVISLWITKPMLQHWLPITDTNIALCGALLLFITPIDIKQKKFALPISQVAAPPWHILILLGGGLSLASAITDSGLANVIGSILFYLHNIPTSLIALILITLIILLTELTSNIATTATFLPVIAAFANANDSNSLIFIFPATLAASCAFMLPVATPPNAVVFSSGKISMPQMIRSGLYLNILFIILLEGYAIFLNWYF